MQADAYRREVREAFERAAASYDSGSQVQREICGVLAALRDDHPPQRLDHIVDAGCGTGYGLGLLADRFPRATLIGLDFAPAMLSRALAATSAHHSLRLLCADLEALPLAPASIDAAWSSLALQWCDPRRALAELGRILKPGGSAWLATLGPRTLCELRDAFTTLDDRPHAIPFHPALEWEEHAARAGFTILERRPYLTCTLAPDLRGLIRHLKSIGAHRVPARRTAPIGRSAWRVLEAHYERHRRSDGLLPATYDVVLFALRKK